MKKKDERMSIMDAIDRKIRRDRRQLRTEQKAREKKAGGRIYMVSVRADFTLVSTHSTAARKTAQECVALMRLKDPSISFKLAGVHRS